MPAPAQTDGCAQSGDPSADDDHAHAKDDPASGHSAQLMTFWVLNAGSNLGDGRWPRSLDGRS
jgi:hypothetical protein